MFNGSRAHNRRLVKADWSTIRWMLSYKAGVVNSSTRGTSGVLQVWGNEKSPERSGLRVRAEGGKAA